MELDIKENFCMQLSNLINQHLKCHFKDSIENSVEINAKDIMNILNAWKLILLFKLFKNKWTEIFKSCAMKLID